MNEKPPVNSLVGTIPLDRSDYQGSDRRVDDRDEWRKHVDKCLGDGAETMRQLRADVAENTRQTHATHLQAQATNANTSEVVDLLNSFKGAFKVLESLGKLARPLGFIAAAVAAFVGLWAAIKGGGGMPR